MKIILPLIFAKSMFKIGQYKECFESLQQEYFKNPKCEVFLYKYGKFVVKSKQMIYMGSAIGILEECLNCCNSQRRAKICYYLGLGYRLIQRPLKSFDTFELANKYFGENKVQMCP